MRISRRSTRATHRSTTGEVATYIPELSIVDPSLFGICLATVDGAVYEAGDTRAPFTIQSMSKPLTYGLALERLGTEAVRQRIGVEPSGDAFNEISISPETGMPRNPLINAGAIACAGLVASDADDPYGLLVDTYSRYVGHPLELDEAVYRSESDTGHRNRGMAHILRELRRDRRPRRRTRPLLPPVLALGRLPRSRDDRRDAGERWRQPVHRRARRQRGRSFATFSA